MPAGDRDPRSVAPATASARAPAARWLDTALLLLLGATVLFAGLGTYPLWDPDEGRHAGVARQMAASDRWLVPTIYGEPYYDKPAPFYWLLRASRRLVANDEFAARLPSALATLATLALLHRFALARFGRRAAFLGALIYATAPGIVALGRFCNLDATLTAFVTAAVLGWLTFLERPERAPLQAYLAMAGGTLIKGPVALALPALIGAGCALRADRLAACAGRLRPTRGALLIAALIAPWLVPAAIADPSYIATFLVKHNFERYTSQDFDHAHGPLFYVPALIALLFPWSLLIPAACSRAARPGAGESSCEPGARPARTASRVTTEADLALWAAIVVLFFSLGRAKLATYVLPALPALALWLGIRLARLSRSGDGGARAVSASPAAWLRGAVALWATVLVAAPIVVWAIARGEFPSVAAAAPVAALLPLLGFAGAVLAWAAPQRLTGVPLVFAGGNALIAVVAYVAVAPVVSLVASDQRIAQTARDLAPGVAIVSYAIQPSSLSFYAALPVRRADLAAQVRRAADAGPLLIVSRKQREAELEAQGIHLYPWLDCERHCLYGTFPKPALAGQAVDRIAARGGRDPS